MMWVEWTAQFYLTLLGLLPVAVLFSFIQRKVTAVAQARSGPNRLGPRGSLQGVGDILKLFQKAPRLEFGFWLGASLWAFGTLLLLPMSSQQLIVETELSAFWPLLFVLGTSFWEGLVGSQRKQLARWLAGLRGLAQGMSALFPAFIAVVAQGAVSSSFATRHWIERQGAWPMGWAVFEHPVAWINFLVFWMSGMVAWGWKPFETYKGLWARQGGINYTMVVWIRFYGMVSWLVFTCAFFLGGWKLGFDVASPWIEWGVLWCKVLVLFLGMVFLQAFTMRLRADQATTFSWEVLAPWSLLGAVGSIAWAVWRG